MSHRATRRTFLSTAGLAALGGLAGCVGAPPSTTERSPTTERRSSPAATPEPARWSADPREYRGELLHAPDDWSGWSAYDGTLTETSETAFLGETSMRLEDVDGSRVRCRYPVEGDPLDLRDHALCAALRWDLPDRVVRYAMILEDGSGNRLAALANAVPSAPETDDDWVMTEFGHSYLLDDEFVDLADITELKLVFNNGGSDATRLYIDNIRLVPYEPRRGAVSFTADDGNVGQIATMRPMLREYGFPSTHFNMKSKTGHDGQLSREQLQEIAAEPGCRVSPHPQHDLSLPQMPDDESRAAIRAEYEFHADELGLGHEHARYMSWPRGASDTGTIAQAREFHDLAFDGVAGATAGWTSAAPMSIARASFDDLDDLLRGLDIAEHYGRVFTPQFHRFRDDLPTADGNVTPEDFQTFVDEVASRDLDVVSLDDLARAHEQG